MISATSAISAVTEVGMTSSSSRIGTAPAAGSPVDFGSVLGNLAASAIDQLKHGEAAAIAGIQGAMPVQQVVEQVMEAERTLQASLAIRDKLVSSFLEISRMQI